MIIVVIVLLVLAIAVLIAFNMSIHKKLEAYKNLNQKFHNLEVLQDFISIAGEESTVDDKLRKIVSKMKDEVLKEKIMNILDE